MSLRIVVHNVGHGQSIHAFTPSGHVVVVDLGASNTFSPLAWLRQQTSVIDSLVITHPHGDHIDQILDLGSIEFTVRQLWRPKWLTSNEVRQANQVAYEAKVTRYLEMSEKYSAAIPPNERVGNPAVTGGVTISKYASEACGRSNINNHSGVVVFDYLGIKLLIPGDNEAASWQELLNTQAFVSAAKTPDVLLASHHGRDSGYCAELFDDDEGIGKPRLCMISDGRVQDTDATGRYSYHSRGWTVHARSGSPSVQRFCVTTRKDGYIDIKVGQQINDGSAFLSVTAD